MLPWGTSFLFRSHRAEGAVLTLQQKGRKRKERTAAAPAVQSRAGGAPCCPSTLRPRCALLAAVLCVLCANGIPAGRGAELPLYPNLTPVPPGWSSLSLLALPFNINAEEQKKS